MPRSIKIIGIAPPDLASSPLPVRRQFWAIVAPIALAVKDKELAAGLDAKGEELKPISPATRKHRRSAMTPSGKGSPEAPPLMPAYQKSRTRSLLAARVLPTHVELYWRFDPFTGDQWATILGYQKKMGRDVFGVSPAGMKEIKVKSWAAWTKWKKSGLSPTEGPLPALPSAALTAGPQSRIAQIIAGSALPNAGARGVPQVGSMSTKYITRGIQAPTVKELKAGGRTGGLTGADWRRYYTAETGGGSGGVVVKPPKPQPIKPRIVAAMKPAAAVKPATFEQSLAKAIEAARTKTAALTDPAEKLEAMGVAIVKTIKTHATKGPTATFHGMSTDETFRTIEFWGIKWHFTGTVKPDSPIARTVYEFGRLQARKKLPARLVKATSDVYFTSQENRRDDYWRKEYNNPLHVSKATGGSGTVAVYRNNALNLGDFAHESGHNLATRLYGTTEPTKDYKLAIQSAEPPVSRYAKNSPAEDFAEAIRVYVEEPDRMKRDFPIRYKVIHKILSDAGYGG